MTAARYDRLVHFIIRTSKQEADRRFTHEAITYE